jgi:hypothetical protein
LYIADSLPLNKVGSIPIVLDAVTTSITAEIDKGIEANVKALDRLITQMASGMPQGRVSNDDDVFAVTSYFYYTLEKFEKGKCLFFKADYNQIETTKATDGILYFDDRSCNWMIHAIYTGAPFDYKMSNGKVTKIKLQKCRGGVVIDGIPHLFIRKNTLKAIEAMSNKVGNLVSIDIVEDECEYIKSQFSSLQETFRSCKNLFVSADDKKLIAKQLTKVGKSLDELDIKLQNTKLLISK